MLTHLRGTIAEKHPTRVVIDVGGVGYEVFIPLSSFDRLPSENEACRILTYDCVRDDAHTLFGFMTEAERSMFIMLMSITGIGPKLALSALSGLSVREIKRAIVENDVKRLCSIPGVGKKTADRMALELRHKISEGDALEAVAGPDQLHGDNVKIRDAVLALVALGYKQDEARKAVAAVLHKDASAAQLTVEELVKKALAGR
jgi:holliday junction DNA helicase RuvA